MYVSKENVNKVLNQLELTGQDFKVYVDMKFFLKDVANPYKGAILREMDTLDMHKHLIDLHDIISKCFRKPTYFVISLDEIEVKGLPNYKKEFYEKYFRDEDRLEFLLPTKEALKTMVLSSIHSEEKKAFDSSSVDYDHVDELGFIKTHKGDSKALVITRDEMFLGYDDIIVVSPEDIADGFVKPKTVLNYQKIVYILSGMPSYSLKGIKGMTQKAAEKLIKKIENDMGFIYYKRDSSPQPLIPITIETFKSNMEDFNNADYQELLDRWDLLNRTWRRLD